MLCAVPDAETSVGEQCENVKDVNVGYDLA